MKITRVEMYSGAEPVAEFNISDLASKSPFVAKAITGLDASEITPVFSGNSLDGQGGFYEFSLPARQIAIRTALRQDLHHELRTVSNLRDELYRAISATRMGIVEIRFCNGADVEAVIYGRVVKMEVDHFSKYAEAQVTLQCDDPFLYGPSSVVVTPDHALI